MIDFASGGYGVPQLVLTFTIPPASSAFITLTGVGNQLVRCNGKPLASSIAGVVMIKHISSGGGTLIIHVDPGHYQLTYKPHALSR